MKTLSTLVVIFLFSLYLNADASISKNADVTSPTASQTNVAMNHTVTWSAAESNLQNPTIKYRVQVSEQSNFSSILFQSGDLSVTSLQLPTSGLAGGPAMIINKVLHVRIVASDDNFSSSSNGSGVSFRSIEPSNLQYITSAPKKLDWDDISTASGYDVQVSTSSSFTSLVVDQSGLASSQFAVDLTPGTYYMRVRATNSLGTGDFKASSSFVAP